MSWGRLFRLTHPVPGNHEYQTQGAAGYYSYFGSLAGDPTKGYYSFDIGAWHIIALNSECANVGGCGGGSPEEVWLRNDLAAHTNTCTLAYWHRPRFTSGFHGNDDSFATWWFDLYTAHADIVLNGHDHDYERFAPQDGSQKQIRAESASSSSAPEARSTRASWPRRRTVRSSAPTPSASSS